MEKGEMQCDAPVEGIKPAVVAIIVLCVLVVTAGIMYFMFVRPLKQKVDDLSGALDACTNDSTTSTPKGVLANANLEETGRDRIIRVMEENGQGSPKGLITPGANELFKTQLLKP